MVAGVNGELGWEVVAIGERAGESEVGGPVAPDIDVTGIETSG
jgi:hypothetical protein